MTLPRRNNRITIRQLNDMLRLRTEGVSLAKIAELTGWEGTRDAVCKRVKHIPSTAKTGRPRVCDIDKAVRLRAQGLTLKVIAERMNVSQPTVLYAIRAGQRGSQDANLQSPVG